LLITWIVVTAVVLIALALLAAQPFVMARAWSGGRASSQALAAHVRMLAETLPGRGDDARKLAASADYIHSEFEKHGSAEFQEFDVFGAEFRNVLLRFDQGAPRTIVVGAHYDTYAGLPGADDNASGVAALLELARLLGEAAPAINVELVAYALEEPPYFGTRDMGSYHHASATSAELAIVLEMIGYFRDEPGSQHYPLPFLRHLYSDRGDFIALIGRFREIRAVRRMKGAFLGAAAVPAYSLTLSPMLPSATLSDHSCYWANGVSAVMVTDTAFERNPYYHTPDDTPDKLDYPRMAEVVNGIYASLFALAGD
jgi:hypothetical protein